MQPELFTVYMATNTVNGKRYIGATRKGMQARRRHHLKDAVRPGKTRDCPRFYDAIRKYGGDAFEWIVLATLSTAEEMYKEEERLIAAMKPEYNIAVGGLIFTSKERQKAFAFARAQKCSKPVICLNDGAIYPSAVAAERALGLGHKIVSQQCQREGITRQGLSFAFYAAPMSERKRQEMLAARKARKAVAEQARKDKCAQIKSRPVTDLRTGIIYISARAADQALNLVNGTAESCCRRGRAMRNGECFAFGQLCDLERSRLLALATEKRRTIDAGWKEKIGKKNSRMVICENTHRLYDNPTIAAIDLGLSPDTIYTHCRNGKVTQSGLSFAYLDEWCPNPE